MKNMARPGFEPTINQSKANKTNHWTKKALREMTLKSEIMKNKRNKKLNKDVIYWKGRILPTIQQKPINFNSRDIFDSLCDPGYKKLKRLQ